MVVSLATQGGPTPEGPKGWSINALKRQFLKCGTMWKVVFLSANHGSKVLKVIVKFGKLQSKGCKEIPMSSRGSSENSEK